MKLSVVIVNWNSKEQTMVCLNSFRKHCSDLDLQIIVVDGGSFDGCDKMIEESYPEVLFIQSQENGGFGKSNNLGAQAATGKALLLINPDTEVEPGAVQHLLQELQELPTPGIIGPCLLNSDGTRQEGSVHAFPSPINQALDSNFLRRNLPKSGLWKSYEAFNSKSSTQVDAVGGACMMMWKETFEKVDGFTRDYFMYAEDMDLCFKIQRLGLKNYHAPQAKIWHHEGGSSEKQFSNFSSVLMPHSLYIFMKLNYGYLSAFVYRLLMLVSSFFRLILLKASSLFSPSEIKSTSCKRWRAVFSWALGREKWTQKYQ